MKTEFPEYLVDECIDLVLRASGSALAYYTMPDSIAKLRAAMQIAMNRAVAATPNPGAEPATLTKSDLNIIRQWYNAVQDVSPKYLNTDGINDDAVFSKVAALIGAAQPPAVAVQGDRCKHCGADLSAQSTSEGV